MRRGCKTVLHANTSFIDAGSSTEYQFLRANFKFRAAKAVFARKVQKLIPLDRNTNMNLIELLLLRPECSYLSKALVSAIANQDTILPDTSTPLVAFRYRGESSRLCSRLCY